jgi:DNA processing protein
MTDYGRRVIEKIIPHLVFEKKTIVSGFMYGVDQYAHEVCMENGGKTIAVLGWGIEQVMEGADRKIADRIVSSGGLLLSEWKDQEATLWTFPVRNRIVAALSADIIVVEAAVKSGSLITANIARKLKRKLWAVPGPITSRLSGGTNMLIAEGYAKMWQGDAPAIQIKKSDDPLLAVLEGDGLTANDIARRLGKPVSEIGAQLSLLSVTGQLNERGGKYYLNYVDQN